MPLGLVSGRDIGAVGRERVVQGEYPLRSDRARRSAVPDGSTVLTATMSLLLEFWSYLRARRKFWLLPVLLVLLLFGGLMILAKGSAIAPFIYTIF